MIFVFLVIPQHGLKSPCKIRKETKMVCKELHAVSVNWKFGRPHRSGDVWYMLFSAVGEKAGDEARRGGGVAAEYSDRPMPLSFYLL